MKMGKYKKIEVVGFNSGVKQQKIMSSKVFKEEKFLLIESVPQFICEILHGRKVAFVRVMVLYCIHKFSSLLPCFFTPF